MSYFRNGHYLQVLTPQTIDGNVPLMVNGKQQYKESHLPLTARKRLEARNAKRPAHLKHIINEVSPVSHVNPTGLAANNTPPADDLGKALATAAGVTQADEVEVRQPKKNKDA